MKTTAFLALSCLLCLNFVAESRAFSVRAAIETINSLFETTPRDSEYPSDCQLKSFSKVENFDFQKFSGDWYEIGRTATKLPEFKSALWRFSPPSGNDHVPFIFSSRLVNGECLKPIAGEVTVQEDSPGTLIFHYDGLKSTVREELLLIKTDYTDVAVLYGCVDRLDDDTCSENAQFVSVLSRTKSVQQPLLESVSDIVRSVCVDPRTIIPQNSADSCDLQDVQEESLKRRQHDSVWPACKDSAVCTLACPKCCVEDENGCIWCNSCSPVAGYTNSNGNESCEDVTSCPAECVRETKPGCSVCDCPPPSLYQGPARSPTQDETTGAFDAYKVENVFDCPTNCRSVNRDDGIYCDCFNSIVCEELPNKEDCPGEEESYYFDTRTQTCHAFFGKCRKTRNSFNSSKDCMAFCADVCSLPPDQGPCKGKHIRYYHNPIQGKCDTFVYGGCGGNENNFGGNHGEALCNRRCPGAFKDTAQMSNVDATCLLKEERGSCNDMQLRYHYDQLSKSCKSFFYSGCDGNANNFVTPEDCKKKCSPSKSESSCKDEGPCNLDKCEIVLDKNGCYFCDCPNSASGLSISLSTFATFLILLFFINFA